MGLVSLRNGVPVSSSRRVAGSNASRTASPQLLAVAAVVHLVEDHERAPAGGAGAVQGRRGGDAGVGDRDAVVVGAGAAHRVAEPGVERDADPGGRERPLRLEVLGRRDDGDRLHHPAGEQLGGHPQRERRLAGAGRRDREEVLRAAAQVGDEGGALPGAQGDGGGAAEGAAVTVLGGCSGGRAGGTDDPRRGSGRVLGDEVEQPLDGLQQRHLEVGVASRRPRGRAASPPTARPSRAPRRRRSSSRCRAATSGQARMPTAAGFTACQTSTYGWPVTSTQGLVTEATMRLSLLPGTRWSTSTPSRRPRPGRNWPTSRGRSSTPSSASTTTPSTRRSSPQTRSTSWASCLPSTQIRLPTATRARWPCTAIEPDAVVRRPVGGLRHRAGQDDRAAVEQEAGPEREDPHPAAPVLQRHPLLVALDDGADPAADRLLHDERRRRRGRSARAAAGAGTRRPRRVRTACWTGCGTAPGRPYGGGRDGDAGSDTRRPAPSLDPRASPTGSPSPRRAARCSPPGAPPGWPATPACPSCVERVCAHDDLHVVAGLDPLDDRLALDRAVARLRAGAPPGCASSCPPPATSSACRDPAPFTTAALEASEGVLALRADGTGTGLVPTLTAHGSPFDGVVTTVSWTAFPVAAAGPDPGPFLHDAEHDLRRGVVEVAGVLRDLDVARWRPEVAEALQDLRRQARAGLDDDELPGGYPARARDLLVRARQLGAVVQLALEDTGGAVDTREAVERERALRGLGGLVRRARVAAYNAYGLD